MTLTEIVFEVGDDRLSICRVTQPPQQASIVYRILDSGLASGRFRGLLTFYGAAPLAEDFVRQQRASARTGTVEVLSSSDDVTTLRTETPTTDPRTPNVRLSAVLQMLSGFGPDTILEPLLVRSGRIRARLLVPRAMETQHVLLALQELQRRCGFSEFRVVRVTNLDAVRYVDILRRLLTPEQEDLLRLALEMGYYETPKRATLGEIAARVGLSVSPIHKKLKAAEETLIQAHVEPASAATPTRRRRRFQDLPATLAGPVEVALRVRAPNFGPAEFIRATPGARALVQIVREDRTDNRPTLLLVLLGPEEATTRYATGLVGRPGVLSVDVLSRDAHHASLRVHADGRVPGCAYDLSFVEEALGPDTVLRPIIFEGEDATVRVLCMRGEATAHIQDCIERTVKAADWDDAELISLRPVAAAKASVPPPERLTPRQEEVLKISHALGYYRTPRACTLEQVAKTLGVSANAIHKNLASAEQKVISQYLAAGL